MPGVVAVRGVGSRSEGVELAHDGGPPGLGIACPRGEGGEWIGLMIVANGRI